MLEIWELGGSGLVSLYALITFCVSLKMNASVPAVSCSRTFLINDFIFSLVKYKLGLP